MSVTEAQRHHLYQLVKSHYDDEAAETLMNLLPPVGWADVATKQDIARVEQRIDRLEARIDGRIDGLQSSFVGWLLASQAIVVAIIGAATAAIIAVG